MKTAISLPDPVFHAAESAAKRLGISRSELYATALADYLKKYDDAQITAKYNEIYSEEDSTLDPAIAQLQYMSMPSEEW